MRVHRLARAALLLALLAGCAGGTTRQVQQLRRDPGTQPVIVIMPIDVELAELTVGGMPEPNAEWTEAAQANIRAALERRARTHNVRLVNFDSDRGTAEEQEMGTELVALHRAVGMAALTHYFLSGQQLPSKDGRFDWSLGPSASAIARSQQADYALFLFVRDSYASAGRVAVSAVLALMGALVAPGGSQIGFASLVDLKTGDIVWFKWLQRPAGDLRTAEAAQETVQALVSDSMK